MSGQYELQGLRRQTGRPGRWGRPSRAGRPDGLGRAERPGGVKRWRLDRPGRRARKRRRRSRAKEKERTGSGRFGQLNRASKLKGRAEW